MERVGLVQSCSAIFHLLCWAAKNTEFFQSVPTPINAYGNIPSVKVGTWCALSQTHLPKQFKSLGQFEPLEQKKKDERVEHALTEFLVL